MIAGFGFAALVLALIAASVQTFACFLGAHRQRGELIRMGCNAALLQAAFLVMAFACLVAGFLASDFSLALVAAHSHSAKPLLFKFAASWGNHEGSLALWVLILALAGAWLALDTAPHETITGKDSAQNSDSHPCARAPLCARALGMQGILGCLFLAFLLFASNPFARLHPPPADGMGLNPVLQDVALAIHPPFLYLGYVGLSVPFSLAVAALLEGRADAAWARRLRLWTLASWSMLTIGIVLGSWWAYRELGWGGFWFWDPVENASLMPWLLAIALLHCAMVAEKRGALRQWSVLLAILAFSLAMLGTFLVRSGVLVSVHSFAADPTRGIFILAILAAVSGGALSLFAWRGGRLGDETLFAPVSREGAILINNMLLCCGCASIFVGTLYPLALEALGGDKISVGAPFFNLTFAPLMLPLFLLLPLGPALAWRRGQMLAAMQRLQLAVLPVLPAFVLLPAYGSDTPLWAVFAAALGVWILAGTVCEAWQRLRLIRAPGAAARFVRAGLAFWGMSLAHGGVGVLLLGITFLSAWSVERIEALRPGDSLTLADFHLSFQKSEPLHGANYLAERAHLLVRAPDGTLTLLHPERRIYPIRGIATSETAIEHSLGGDLYAVLGDYQPADDEAQDGLRIFRLYWNPLVSLIWLGAGMMACGGLLALAAHWRRGDRSGIARP